MDTKLLFLEKLRYQNSILWKWNDSSAKYSQKAWEFLSSEYQIRAAQRHT